MPDKKKEQASAVGTHCNLALITLFYIIDIVGFCLTVSLIATSVCLFPLWKTYWIWKVSVYADYKAAYRISLIRSVVITSISSVVLELTATWYSWQKKCPSDRVRTHCMSVFFSFSSLKLFSRKRFASTSYVFVHAVWAFLAKERLWCWKSAMESSFSTFQETTVLSFTIK